MTSSPPPSSSRPTSRAPRALAAAAVAGALVVAGVVAAGPDVPAPPPGAGAVTGKVVVSRDGKKVTDYREVVVYIKDAADPPGAPRPEALIRQKHQTFTPRLTVVPAGTTIRFPNDDRVEHNVFSPYTGPEYFDLGRYKSGAGKAQTFSVAGEVDIFCDIHPQMAAKVKVVPSSHFAGPGGKATVAADGTYRIEGVPAGRHRVVAWLPDSTEVQTRVVVPAGAAVAAADLNLQQGKPAATHTRRDGSSYPAYP